MIQNHHHNMKIVNIHKNNKIKTKIKINLPIKAKIVTKIKIKKSSKNPLLKTKILKKYNK